ncbi:BTB/POZ domain-containing protein KCTD4-like [Diadema setosum]|uniref:BTB/POZ domain-containing protein KCTD4-like n=1 Tax=Diadema setosum TaxID=31175 RepID=UPI003B3A1E87
MNDVISLNVGGTIYTTSRATLCRFPDSMLGSMFSDRLPSTRDEKGNYLIDGDGPLFRHVLNFLRRSVLVLPEDFKELDMLAQEADYYQINELIEAVTQLGNEKEEAKRRQEFLELELVHEANNRDCWSIFGSRNILQKIPVLIPYLGKACGTYEAYEGIRVRDAFGTPPLDRIKLYEQIAQLGFRLASLSSRGGDGQGCYCVGVDRWIFARDAKTASGTDPKAI